MKKTALIIIALTLAFACKNGAKKNSNPNKEKVSSSEFKASKEEVCERVFEVDVARIMNWSTSKITKKQDFSFDRYNFSSCSYTDNETSEFVLLKVYHKSEKAIENKVLENQFSNFLSNGNQKYVYKEIAGKGTQTILGTYSNRNLHFYHLKMRIDNNYELSTEITTAQPNDEEIEKQLLQLVALLSP
jgi:hypothetical protein